MEFIRVPDAEPQLFISQQAQEILAAEYPGQEDQYKIARRLAERVAAQDYDAAGVYLLALNRRNREAQAGETAGLYPFREGRLITARNLRDGGTHILTQEEYEAALSRTETD